MTFLKENVWILYALLYLSIPFLIVNYLNYPPEIIYGVFENISQIGIIITLFYYRDSIRKKFSKIEIILIFISFFNVLSADFFFTIFMNTLENFYKEIFVILIMRLLFTVSYILFILFLVIFLLKRMKKLIIESKFSIVLNIVVSTLFFTTCLIFILSTDLYFKDKLNFYLFLFLTFFDSIAVGTTIAMTSRSNKLSDFLFLQIILLLCFADLSIAYHEYLGTKYGSSLFEPAWLIGMMSLFALFLKEKGLPLLSAENFTSNYSLRTMMSASILIVLILSFCILNYLNMISLQNIDKLSIILFISYCVWFIANLVSMQCSNTLINLNLQIIKPNYSLMNLINNKLIEENLYHTIPVKGIYESNEIITKYNNLALEANEIVRNFREKTKRSTIIKIAKKVGHDIKSPLSILNSMLKLYMNDLPEDVRNIIRKQIVSMHDIANELLTKNEIVSASSTEAKQTNTELVISSIEEIITENRINFRSCHGVLIETEIYEERNYGLFAKMNFSQFKCIISNIINNAVESFLNKEGKILVRLKPSFNKTFNIEIIDNGKGIPEDLLPLLGYEGLSFGKERISDAGSGLGLFHARSTIESWGGTLNIKSKVGLGTDIIISLPCAAEPKWFVSNIALKKKQTIVIIDDEQGIHQVWENRFKKLPLSQNKISIVHLSNPKEFEEWIKGYAGLLSDILCLCDYEFSGYEKNGLDLLENYKIKNSILITYYYECENIKIRCENLAIGLIPKMLVGFVPLDIVVE